ncbi:MAG: hypothetical protein IKN00_04265 [Bacteroidales bacterium]|nr:hypothetical protein [Bacteroidales bacterium]
MDSRIVLGILGGCAPGGGFVYYCFRHGLSPQEWIYFMSFLYALRRGNYEEREHDEEEGSEEDGTQD